jgi:hypothetical protein
MRCEQARQLFDAYLDGELSPALATELGAHRVQCAECRRALALLEVTGHILASDREPVRLGADFSDRLLACMALRPGRWTLRARRTLYIGGPLAAAAVVALAFIGVFDRPEGQRLGAKEAPPDEIVTQWLLEAEEQPATEHPAELALDEWSHRARENVDSTRLSGESLHEMLDLTVRQWIDILNEANAALATEDQLPALDNSDSSKPTSPLPDGERDQAGSVNAPAEDEDVDDR